MVSLKFSKINLFCHILQCLAIAMDTKVSSPFFQFDDKDGQFQLDNQSVDPLPHPMAYNIEPPCENEDMSLSPQPGSSHSIEPDTGRVELQSNSQSPEFDTKDQPSSSSQAKLAETLHVNCICRNHIWDSSMIKCHSCKEYFHGDCVGISRPKAAMLKHFYCPLCIDNDSNLVTEFEEKETTIEPKQKEQDQKPKDGKKPKSKKHSRR